MDELKEILTKLTDSVYLYTAPLRKPIPYIVFGADGANDLSAENHHSEKADQGYIDLYTKSQTDSLISSVPQALDENEISYYLNSVQYEDETGLLHYEWIWEN